MVDLIRRTLGDRRRPSLVPLRFAAAVIAALALLTSMAGGVLAAAPSTNEFIVDTEFVDPFWTETCGFEVRQHITGTIKVLGSLNEEGQLLPSIERYQLTHELIGSGGAVSWQDRGSDSFIAYHADGTVTIEATGVVERIVVPGEGLVWANIGRFTEIVGFDPATGEHLEDQVTIIWKVGPSPEDADAADVAAVCAWLAG